MNIKFSKKKEELRKDPVMEYMQKTKDYVTKNSRELLITLVVIIIAGGGVQAYLSVRNSTVSKAQNEFGKAMILYQENQEDKALDAFRDVYEKYGNTQLGAYSAYMLGQLFLRKGNYNETLLWLEKVVSYNKNIGFVRGESLEAMGVCYDAMNDREKALESFTKALDDKSINYRHPAIRWKIILLYKNMGDKEKMNQYCKELISDTLAVEYRKKAENLLAVMQTM